MGAGALISRSELRIGEPLIKGGGQERSLRAGTENVAAIAGFGAAAAIAASLADAARMAGLRDRLEASHKGGNAGGGDFRGKRAAAAQYHAVRGSRHEGRNGNNRL